MRFDDWEQRLHALTLERLSTPYEWGVNDCALFAADAVLAMTGKDPMAEFRGRYDSQIGALRLISDMGKDSLGDAVATMLDEIEPARLSRGDVGLFDGVEGPFLAIVQGVSAVAPGADGLTHVKTVTALRGFRV